MAEILNNQFTSQTWSRLLASDRQYFGSRCRTNKPKGSFVICRNVDDGTVVGIAILGAFSNGDVCREHHLLDDDVYVGEHAKYNRFDICIESIHVFTTPKSSESLANILGIDNKVRNNITKGMAGNFVGMFYKSDDEEKVLERLRFWISCVLNV